MELVCLGGVFFGCVLLFLFGWFCFVSLGSFGGFFGFGCFRFLWILLSCLLGFFGGFVCLWFFGVLFVYLFGFGFAFLFVFLFLQILAHGEVVCVQYVCVLAGIILL